MTSSKAMKIEIEIELQSPVEKLWNALKESTTIFPKAIPHIYENIQTRKGDGKSVGSVRLINYVEGKLTTCCAMEKIESVDEEDKTISYSMTDGDILNYYKDFKYSIGVVPKGDGSMVKWSSQYEITSELAPCTCSLKHFAIMNLQDLDDYLLRN